jgi:hypothetical protein
MKLIKHLLFLAATAAITLPATAQMVTDTEPIILSVDGYVVTNTQDTIPGKVAVSRVSNYVTQITFKDEKGTKTKYTPDQLMAFSQKRPKLLRDYNDLTTFDKESVHYESKEHPNKAGKKVFMERLLDGSRIKLFNNPSGGESSTTVAGFKLKENESSYVVFKQGSKPFVLKRKNYEEEFASLFGDCASFMDYAKDKPDLKKFKQLGTVVENYNTRCR